MHALHKMMKRLMHVRLTRNKLIAAETALVLCACASIWLNANFTRLFGKDEWTLTQYGLRDINASFYTIYNPKQGLIVVDGGWREDADEVERILKQLGGHVDAWFLTHPHQDHVGAFTALWERSTPLSIDHVYTVPMASPQECAQVAPWDSTDAYREFLALDIPQLSYVTAGETYGICTLTFDILSTYSEEVTKRSRDYLNDGSMMFKVTGPHKSFLFCADVGKSMSKYLQKQYKDVLKSDYVQMGHHGNGGLKKAFYEAVAPSAAFFDAPDWLMNNEGGSYDTPNKIALMEGMGAQILSFHTAPNRITL